MSALPALSVVGGRHTLPAWQVTRKAGDASSMSYQFSLKIPNG